jgi:trehalose 6-phosphate phosphatase
MRKSSHVIEQILSRIKQGKTLFGLDFDGTLVDLQTRPELVKLSTEKLAALSRLSEVCELSFITGRAVPDLLQYVPLEGRAHFIGNHGSEILYKDGSRCDWKSEEWLKWREQGLSLFDAFAHERGAWIEDKGLTLTVHYRGAQNWISWWDNGQELATALAAFAGGSAIHLLPGLHCWNLLPKGAPNKGIAAVALCRELGFEQLIYFGDEQTDETVFVKRNEFSVLGIKVGEGATEAELRVSTPEDVFGVIKGIIEKL